MLDKTYPATKTLVKYRWANSPWSESEVMFDTPAEAQEFVNMERQEFDWFVQMPVKA